MNIQLKNQKWCVFGVQGSGKTELAKKIISTKFKRPLVYAFHEHDWNKLKCVRWHPQKDKDGIIINSKEDMDLFIRKAISFGKQKKIDCVVIDEADMFFQWNYNLDGALNDLILNHRHYNLSVGFISRRPQDIPTKIVESCKAGFFFAIEGDNVYKKLRNIHPELEEKVKQLQHQDHRFVVKILGQKPFIHQPIPL